MNYRINADVHLYEKTPIEIKPRDDGKRVVISIDEESNGNLTLYASSETALRLAWAIIHQLQEPHQSDTYAGHATHAKALEE